MHFSVSSCRALANLLRYYAIYGTYPSTMNTLPTVRELSGQTCSTSDCAGSSTNGCPGSTSSSGCSFPASPPSACDSTQTTFINNMLSYAKTASQQTELPVSFILGQWGRFRPHLHETSDLFRGVRPRFGVLRPHRRPLV